MSNQALTQLTTTATVQSGDLLYVVRSGTTDLALTGDGMLAQFLTAAYAGSSSIVTVGTIATGTWQGSIIGPTYLGTGSAISTKFLRGDGTWQTVTSGSGDVVGPASATDGVMALFDGTTGKLIKVGAVPFDPTNPGPIGGGTPSTITGTTITASGVVFTPTVALSGGAGFAFDGAGSGIVNLFGPSGPGSGFGRMNFGGATASFPAQKRNAATLETVLADDSGFAAAQSLYDRFGSGDPNGTVTAPMGAVYHNTAGGAGVSIYVKESGTGNTGWVPK